MSFFKLKFGFRLPFPIESNQITAWSPMRLYENLSKICYVENPTDRGSFLDVIECIESELSKEEQNLHTQMNISADSGE